MAEYSELSGWADAKFDWNADYTDNPCGAGCVLPLRIQMCLHYALSERVVAAETATYTVRGSSTRMPGSDVLTTRFCSKRVYAFVAPGIKYATVSAGPTALPSAFINNSDAGALIDGFDVGSVLDQGVIRKVWNKTRGYGLNLNLLMLNYQDYQGTWIRAIVKPDYGIVTNTTTFDDIIIADETVQDIFDNPTMTRTSLVNYGVVPGGLYTTRTDTINSVVGTFQQPLLKYFKALYTFFNYSPLCLSQGTGVLGVQYTLTYRGASFPASLAEYSVYSTQTDTIYYPILRAGYVRFVEVTTPDSPDYPGYYTGSATYTDVTTYYTANQYTGQYYTNIPMYYMRQLKWSVRNILLTGTIDWPGNGPKAGVVYDLGSTTPTAETEDGAVQPANPLDWDNILSNCVPAASPDGTVVYNTSAYAIYDFSGSNGFVMFNRD